MFAGLGHSASRVATVVPMAILVLFVGLLWLLGLACGKDRRGYVTIISEQAMTAVRALAYPTSIQIESTELPPESSRSRQLSSHETHR